LNTNAKASPNSAALEVPLTPTQIRGLKLAKEGDLYPQDAKKWTHLDATETFSKTDRFKERPIKVKFATSATLDELRTHGLLKPLNSDIAPEESAHAITMAGKMWLLKRK
jgi:hypothetical protein